MTKASRKIILSVLTLVLTVIALGTTTFAWFSLSTVSNISDISGEVRAGDGLEVRLKGTYMSESNVSTTKTTEWRSHFSDTEVAAFINEIFNAKKFEAVTTTTIGTFTKAGITKNGNILLGQTASANIDFIEFEIEFRSQQAGYVELTELKIEGGVTETAVAVDGASYIQFPGTAESPNTDKTLHPVMASAMYGARVSFDSVVFQYSDDNIKLDNTTITGNTFMGDKGIEAGQWSYLTDSKGLKFFNNEDETSGSEITDPKESLLAAFANADLKVSEEVDAVARVKLELSKESGDTHYSKSVTVRIWIEGWDADSYDVIYEMPLKVSMRFEKETTTP